MSRDRRKSSLMNRLEDAVAAHRQSFNAGASAELRESDRQLCMQGLRSRSLLVQAEALVLLSYVGDGSSVKLAFDLLQSSVSLDAEPGSDRDLDRGLVVKEAIGAIGSIGSKGYIWCLLPFLVSDFPYVSSTTLSSIWLLDENMGQKLSLAIVSAKDSGFYTDEFLYVTALAISVSCEDGQMYSCELRKIIDSGGRMSDHARQTVRWMQIAFP